MKCCATSLRAILDYCPETGALSWRERPREAFTSDRIAKAWNTKHAGKPAFTAKNAYGYYVGSVFGEILQAHRVAWVIATGADAHEEIDHINGDRADNRLINLRSVSAAENRKNMRLPKHNKSGVCGVSWDKDREKWFAKITVDKKQIFLGLYESMEDAAAARASAERRYGFHQNHGSVIA